MGGLDIALNVEQMPLQGLHTVIDFPMTFGPVPKKRKNRARRASLIICAIISICSLAFYISIGLFESPIFFGLLTATLSLLSIVIGTLVGCLCLAVEERHHLNERYDGNHKNMLKACFSGIRTGPVVFLISLTSILLIIIVTCTPMVVLDHVQVTTLVACVFGGIAVGPLVMHLLYLNAECEVNISTILENRRACTGNLLARSYYHNYLVKVLPFFGRSFFSNQTQSDERCLNNVRLHSDKLILLIPHDCYTVDDLNDLDNNISKIKDIDKNGHNFSVYCLKDNITGKEYTCVVQYVKEPLQVLRMLTHHSIGEKEKRECEYQVQLLYTTLTDIVADPEEFECLKKCILVPMKVKNLRELKNGGLVRLIRRKIDAVESTSEVNSGFVQHGKSQSKPSTSTSNGECAVQVKRNGVIEYVERRAEYSKEFEHSDDDTSGRYVMLINSDEGIRYAGGHRSTRAAAQEKSKGIIRNDEEGDCTTDTNDREL